MPLVNVNGEEIFYAQHGEPSGLPIVFIHGAGGTHQSWLGVMNTLRRCNAYALDLPAHGESAGVGRDSVAAYADVIVGFLDVLSLPSALIAGTSLGGAIAQWLALHQLQRVRGLVLASTGAKLRVHPQILNAIQVGRPVPADPTTDKTPPPPPDLKPANPVAYGDWLACDRFDVMNRLGAVHCPTLIVHGDKDIRTPLKYATYLADSIRDARLVTIAGAGHSASREKPAEMAKAIQEFVDSLH